MTKRRYQDAVQGVVGDEVTAAVLRALLPNEHGSAQPRHVRLRLRRLEAQGLVQYDSDKGWSLTQDGVDLAGHHTGTCMRRCCLSHEDALSLRRARGTT
jgi:hypothetical protein